MSSDRTRRSVRPSASRFGTSLSFDHLMVWYRKSNSYSEPLYINSPCFSHMTPQEKSKLRELQTITVRDHDGPHESVILKLGGYSEVEAMQSKVEVWAAAGYTTDDVLKELADSNAPSFQSSSDDEELDDDNDEDYEPQSSPLTLNQDASMGHSSRSEQFRVSAERRREKNLERAYLPSSQCSDQARRIQDVRPGQVQFRNQESSSANQHPSPGPPRGGNASQHPSPGPPRGGNASQHPSPGPPRGGNASQHPSPGPPRGGNASQHPSSGPPRGGNASQHLSSEALRGSSAATSSSGSDGIKVNSSQLILLELRLQTRLLKRIENKQDEEVKMLRELLAPREKENREDRTIQGSDGRSFRLSQLASVPTIFARQLVLRMFGEEFCCSSIIEPKGKSDRTAMTSDMVNELKDCLDSWFGDYSWKVVRASLNQFFRDLAAKSKKRSSRDLIH